MRHLLCLPLALIVPLALTGVRLSGQTGDPSFEVASVKPNKSGDMRVMLMFQPGGRFSGTNVTIHQLLQNAYGLQGFQVVGGPEWVAKDRFDITAKAPFDIPPMPPSAPGAPPNPLQLMVRALLTERFNLKVHTETRELPIYALVVAGTSKLRPAAVDCAARMKELRAKGGPAPMPGPGEPVTCGMQMLFGKVAAGSVTMTILATSLAPVVSRIVVDKTGLAGNYDFEFSWTPDRMGTPPPGVPPPPPIDSNGPSIFTALQEQLGLKLDAENRPVEVLVIDHVEPPTPD